MKKATGLLPIFALGALGVALLACGSDDDAPPANAGGSTGVVASRAQNCATIDLGVKNVSELANRTSLVEPGTDASGDIPAPPADNKTSACESFLLGCSDADLAVIAPQYSCYASRSAAAASLTELQATCPGADALSEACTSSISSVVPQNKAACANPDACWRVATPNACGGHPVGSFEYGVCVGWLNTWCTFAWYMFQC